MSRFRKLSHVTWYCQYHFVWVPKYRYRVQRIGDPMQGSGTSRDVVDGLNRYKFTLHGPQFVSVQFSPCWPSLVYSMLRGGRQEYAKYLSHRLIHCKIAQLS